MPFLAPATNQTGGVKILRFCFGLLLLAGFSLACEKRPSEEQCTVALANFLRIQIGPGSATPEQAGVSNQEINRIVSQDPISRQMIQKCTQDKPYKQVTCEMEAIDATELLECKQFASKK